LPVLETGSTLSLFAANEFSATVASDVTKEGIGQKRPAGHLLSLRRRSVLRARRLGSFDVNHGAILDLFTSVRKNTRVYWASGPTFFASSTVKSAPTTVKAISEIMGIDGNHPGYIEMGLKTVSPHLVKSIMRGKIKPYTTCE
jgi:hypothetical protein